MSEKLRNPVLKERYRKQVLTVKVLGELALAEIEEAEMEQLDDSYQIKFSSTQRAEIV